MSQGKGWRRRAKTSVMCHRKAVFCYCCRYFSLGFVHEFLEFNNMEALKTACQIPHSQTMRIKKFPGILTVDMGRHG